MPSFQPDIPEIIKDQPIQAAPVEAMRKVLLRSGISVADPLVARVGPHGTALSIDLPVKLWAKLSGTTSPYSWVEQVPTSSGWIDGYRSGTNNAYEANNFGKMNGQVVRLTKGAWNDWRFQRKGPCCPPGPLGTICARPVPGCSASTSVISGAKATLSLGGTVVATTSVARNSAGVWQACFAYYEAGTYTVTIVPNDSCEPYQTGSATVTVSTGYAQVNVPLTLPSGWSCCLNGSGATSIPLSTTLYATFQCGPTYTFSSRTSNNDPCTWVNGLWTIAYAGNCTWVLTMPQLGCGPYGSVASCISYASGPPTAPVNLTFGSPGSCCDVGGGCANTIEGDCIGCRDGAIEQWSSAFTGQYTSMWPATVTS